jgi:hypothetical protein
LEAITIALSLFESGQADALLLSGADFLRSGYTAEERKGMMQVFAGGQSHLVGYERVTETFIKQRRHSLSGEVEPVGIDEHRLVPVRGRVPLG